jgi:undecaprenyl-diphosphatase
VVKLSSEPGSTTSDTPRLLTLELTVALIAAALALLIFSWLGREIVAGVTPVADEYLRHAVNERSSPGLTRLMIGASRFGGPAWLIPLGLVLAVAFLAARWRRGALLVVITIAGAALLNTMLKQSFARSRPAAFFEYPLPASHSFPSGHAFFAASFFGGLAALVAGRVRSRALRALVWIVAIGLILLIGISRVYLGVHYPSDVFAGYMAAVVWVAGVAFGDRLVRHRRRRQVA